MTARAGLRFHERTKHCVESVRSVRHWLDWDNRPNPFKEYRGLEALPPPHKLLRYDMPALKAPAEGSAQRRAAELGLPDLARLLRWGAGALGTRRLAGGQTRHLPPTLAPAPATRSRCTPRARSRRDWPTACTTSTPASSRCGGCAPADARSSSRAGVSSVAVKTAACQRWHEQGPPQLKRGRSAQVFNRGA
jgi:hypothetical protein